MGMTLYDIDAQIAALDGAAEDDMLIDQETGELISVSQALDALRMEREAKLENVACWVKNLSAEADAIREEENRLVKRRKAAETKAANLKSWLLAAMTREDGTTDKLKTGRVAVSVKRNPPNTVVDDEEMLPWNTRQSSRSLRRIRPRSRRRSSRARRCPGLTWSMGGAWSSNERQHAHL